MFLRTSEPELPVRETARPTRRLPHLALIVGLLLTGVLAPTVGAAQNDDAATNEEVARRFFDELHTAGDLAVAEEIVAAEAVFHTPDGELVGPDGIAGLVTVLRTAFPDAEFPIEDMIVAEAQDTIVVRWSMTGTHDGAFGDIAPTGNSVAWGGTAILRFAEGQIAEDWVVYDRLSLLQQLGALPGATPAAAASMGACGTCAVTA